MIGKVLAQAVTLPDYAGTGFKFAGMKLGDILSGLLPYIYAIAGIGLLAMIILGGVEIMTSAGDQNKMKSGQGGRGIWNNFCFLFSSTDCGSDFRDKDTISVKEHKKTDPKVRFLNFSVFLVFLS